MNPVLPSRRVTGMPAGTMMASTSRRRVTGSLSWLCTERSLFGRNRFGGAIQRRVQCMPTQARALHAGGKFTHARERRELTELGGIDGRVVLGQQRVHVV